MEKLFKLKEHNTTVRTEILAGITTFFAMAYIIFVNPSFLQATGMEYTAVLVATCVSAAIGSALTAFLSNTPFAQAPGMGLNAFFTYTVCLGMGYTWQQGLAIVFLSGVLFLLVAVSPLRSKIIASIPASLKAAISAGIGLFVTLVGLLNAGIVVTSGTVLDLGVITKGAPLLALIGVVITGILMAWKVKAALILGIVITTVIGIPMGVTTFPEHITMESISMSSTFLKLDFAGLGTLGLLPLVTAIVTFTICDCFDTVGTLIGTAGNAGMLDKDGNLPGGDRALIADAVATCTGALLGTSTVTTFVESSTGIAEGGTFYQVYAPALRDGSYLSGLNQYLRHVESKAGLSYGVLSQVADVEKTATEIISSRQKLYATVSDIQAALEDALRGLIAALNFWADQLDTVPAGSSEPEISFKWDDSIIIDRQTEMAQWQAEIQLGLRGKAEYRQHFYGEDEATARSAVAAIQQEAMASDILQGVLTHGNNQT